MRIKFITLTCEKYHDTRVCCIRETWGENQDITFLSDVNSGNDILGYEYLPKGYENISHKYFEFIRKYENFDYDWYFFTDDDTFVNVDNVKKLLENFNTEDNICIGHEGALNIDGTDMDGNQTGFPIYTISGEGSWLPIRYVSGGAGFILSKKSMRIICDYAKKCENPAKSYNSDVTFGFWMRNVNIKIVDVVGFWWTNPSDLRHNESEINESFTYHYVNIENMQKLKKTQNV